MNYALKQHPLSAAFPAMSAEDFAELKASIEVNGVLNPVSLHEGMIIDGWHRYTAAMQLNMDCPQAELEDWIDPKDFVLAQNKTRRHISQSQLALATAAVYKWYPVGENQHKTGWEVPAHPQKSTKELANIAGVSDRTIKQAKEVLTKAAPEVQEAVKAGKIGLEKAAAISKLPQAEQAQAISKPLPKPELKVVPVEPTPEEEYTELDAAHDKIAELQDALAVASVGNDSEEAQQAAQLIAELRAEIKRLEIALKAVTASRDGYMNQCAELQKQINRQRREIDRATGTRTA
jgi:predicted CoA-binding protein